MYKQVTPDQLDIWLSDPVTKSYLDCLSYCHEAISNHGSKADPSNSSQTQYNAGYHAGCCNTLREALNPQLILGSYERPEVPNA